AVDRSPILCRRESRNAASASASACSTCEGVNCSNVAMTSSVAGLIDSIAPRAVIVGVPMLCLLGFHEVYTGIHARRSYQVASLSPLVSSLSLFYRDRARACHPERSEGSAGPSLRARCARFARDDSRVRSREE